jgi:ribose/xylose/arabinose/galactoside ABC-type transport system permease subunit
MNLSEKQPGPVAGLLRFGCAKENKNRSISAKRNLSSASGRSRIFNMRPASPPQPNREIRRAALDWDLLWEKFGIATVLLLVWILAALATPRFANLDNLASVLRQSAFVGIAAVGMTMAIIAGTFDLSVGSTQALSAWTAVSVAGHGGVLPAFIAAVVVGGMVGLLNGSLVVLIRIPAFIATLGTMFLIGGLTFILTNGQTARFNGKDFVWWGNGQIGNVPVPFLIFLLCALVGVVILHRTAFGRYVFAIGSNIRAAHVAGVPIGRTILFVFVVVGLFTGLGAALLGSRLYSAGPGLEPGFELNVIATVVLGGTRLAGGRGSMLGTIAAAILFATLANVLNLNHVDAFVQRVAVGLVLLLALSVEGIRQRLVERWSRRQRPSNPSD